MRIVVCFGQDYCGWLVGRLGLSVMALGFQHWFCGSVTRSSLAAMRSTITPPVDSIPNATSCCVAAAKRDGAGEPEVDGCSSKAHVAAQRERWKPEDAGREPKSSQPPIPGFQQLGTGRGTMLAHPRARAAPANQRAQNGDRAGHLPHRDPLWPRRRSALCPPVKSLQGWNRAAPSR